MSASINPADYEEGTEITATTKFYRNTDHNGRPYWYWSMPTSFLYTGENLSDVAVVERKLEDGLYSSFDDASSWVFLVVNEKFTIVKIDDIYMHQSSPLRLTSMDRTLFRNLKKMA